MNSALLGVDGGAQPGFARLSGRGFRAAALVPLNSVLVVTAHRADPPHALDGSRAARKSIRLAFPVADRRDRHLLRDRHAVAVRGALDRARLHRRSDRRLLSGAGGALLAGGRAKGRVWSNGWRRRLSAGVAVVSQSGGRHESSGELVPGKLKLVLALSGLGQPRLRDLLYRGPRRSRSSAAVRPRGSAEASG